MKAINLLALLGVISSHKLHKSENAGIWGDMLETIDTKEYTEETPKAYTPEVKKPASKTNQKDIE